MFWRILSFFGILSEMKVSNLNGFVDLRLRITSMKRMNDDSVCLHLRNRYKGSETGFKVKIENKWDMTEVGSSHTSIYWGNGYFVNTGKNTKNFINTLSVLYAVDMCEIREKKIPVKIAIMGNKPSEFINKPVSMKIFFNAGSEKHYSEVFINMDYKKRLFEFNEKDEIYRKALILSLCGNSGE